METDPVREILDDRGSGGSLARAIIATVVVLCLVAGIALGVVSNRRMADQAENRVAAAADEVRVALNADQHALAAQWLRDPTTADLAAVLGATDGSTRGRVLLVDMDGTPLGGFARIADRVTLPADLLAEQDVLVEQTENGLRAIVPVAVAAGETLILVLDGPPAQEVPFTVFLLVIALTVIGILLVLIPLANRREQEMERQRAAIAGLVTSKADGLRQLNQLDRTKSDFLTAVSHSLRTPLQVIQGTSRLLIDRGAQLDPATAKEMAGHLGDAADQLNKRITDLIDVDRLIRGAIVPLRQELDAAEVVAGVVANLDEVDRVRHPLEPVQISADRAHLERIVEHVLQNAVQHSPAGEVVDVDITRDNEATTIVVKDRGPGIPKDERRRVFDPLYRMDDGNVAPGPGLGLALVQRLAHAHGGRAWAEARVDGGAEVWIRIPDEGNDRGVDLWQLTGNVAT